MTKVYVPGSYNQLMQSFEAWGAQNPQMFLMVGVLFMFGTYRVYKWAMS